MGRYPTITSVRGQVTMVRDIIAADAIWKVYKEDGTELSIAGTVTDGLQEAYDYANQNGFSLNVIGGGVKAGPLDHCVIGCTGQLNFGPGQIKTVIFRDVTLNFAGGYSGTGAAWTIDTQAMCDLLFYGQVVCNHAGPAVLFRPSTIGIADPVKDIGVFGCFIRTIAQSSTAAGATCVTFEVHGATPNENINRSYFRFHELNGGRKAVEFKTVGAGVITGNEFVFQGIHGFLDASAGRAVDLGSTGGANITSNRFWINSVSPASPAAVVEVFASDNDIWFDDAGTGVIGVACDSTAARNRVYIARSGASSARFSDGSVDGSNRGFYAGRALILETYGLLDKCKTEAGEDLTATPEITRFHIQAGGWGDGTVIARTIGVTGEGEVATLSIEFTLPPSYVAGEEVTLAVQAQYAGDGTIGDKTLDVEVYEVADDGTVGADLCATAVQTLTSSFAQYVFTITPTNLAPGDRIRVLVQASLSETGGLEPIWGEIGNVELQADMRG